MALSVQIGGVSPSFKKLNDQTLVPFCRRGMKRRQHHADICRKGFCRKPPCPALRRERICYITSGENNSRYLPIRICDCLQRWHGAAQGKAAEFAGGEDRTVGTSNKDRARLLGNRDEYQFTRAEFSRPFLCEQLADLFRQSLLTVAAQVRSCATSLGASRIKRGL